MYFFVLYKVVVQVLCLQEMRTIKVLVVLQKGVLLEYMAQNLVLGEMMGTWIPCNQGEGWTNESNDDRVVDGAEEDDNMTMDSNDKTLTDGMKGIMY